MSSQTKTEALQDLRLPSYGPRWESILEDSAHTPTILVVDHADLGRRLLKGILKAADYRILEATRPSEAFEILKSEKVDLIMVDLIMPEMSGQEFCQSLKADRRTQLIPILMTTSIQGEETEVLGLDSGADDFLLKPIKPMLTRARIRRMLRHKALIDSLEEAETILFALAQAVERRDKYTGLHCERLAAYSIVMAQALGLPKRDQLALFRGGYLHDIGKITTPDSVLFKNGKLTPQEWEIMRQHTLRGEEICRPMKSLAPVLPIIRSHHERWDGSGYPDGLREDETPLLARILQLADIYDALTTARPYKPALSHDETVRIMIEEAERGWRDPQLMDVFVQVSQRWVGGDSGKPDAGMQESIEAMRRALSR